MDDEWSERPEKGPDINWPQVPLAVCAILYSYEGICLILPIESAMKEPKNFKFVFVSAMALVACLLAGVACICVMTFGTITNGSVTAFLLNTYQNDPSISFWIMLANTAVSVSVLLTYPLQLFPAVELMGPWMQSKLDKLTGKSSFNTAEYDYDDDLSAFEPLPPLPEHDVASLDSLPEPQYGFSEIENGDFTQINQKEDEDDIVSTARSAFSSIQDFIPKMTMPGDSPLLRAILVAITYVVAAAVPNVQALISLAGALAGSSTALLIPPVLELAWINHLEEIETEDSVVDIKTDQNKGSVYSWISPSMWWRTYRFDRIKCYLLFASGFVFMCIGTFASLADIVAIYRGGERR